MWVNSNCVVNYYRSFMNWGCDKLCLIWICWDWMMNGLQLAAGPSVRDHPLYLFWLVGYLVIHAYISSHSYSGSLCGEMYAWSDYSSGYSGGCRGETPWGKGQKCLCGNTRPPRVMKKKKDPFQGSVWVTTMQMLPDFLAAWVNQEKVDHSVMQCY